MPVTLTISLTKEAAAKLLANPPKELAGYKVLSIEPLDEPAPVTEPEPTEETE